MAPRPVDVSSVMRRVRREGRCWIWTGRRNAHGYGRVKLDGREPYIHRLVYEWTFGPVPAGQVVMHACDTPSCVNPAHLRAGTQSENATDMHLKGRAAPVQRRTHCKHGHAYTPENTLWHREGYQRCRECMNAPRRRKAS
jgi:hypothetical protein